MLRDMFNAKLILGRDLSEMLDNKLLCDSQAMVYKNIISAEA